MIKTRLAIVLTVIAAACASEPRGPLSEPPSPGAPDAADARPVPYAPGGAPLDGPAPAPPVPGDTLRIPPLRIPYIPPPQQETEGDWERGLEYRLVERTGPTAPDVSAPEPAPLSAAATEALLARLPALPDTGSAEFRFPAASPPPPRTGMVITSGFPPDSVTRPAPPTAEPPRALEVVRVVPTGDTDLAPHVTVTFNQPMVPLTTVAGTEAREPPARLTPEPPGRWTWLDTRTLRFVPVDRLPMATEYTLEIPAGTRSATGTALAAAFRTTFATPAPRAIGAYPALDPDTARQRYRWRGYEHSSAEEPTATSLQPVIVIAFDQAVSPERVLAATQLTADGRALALRLATDTEVEADTIAAALMQDAEPGRLVALRPARPLPQSADVRLIIGTAATSGEGTRAASVAQELRFRTHGPLDVAWHGCYERPGTCPPGAAWTVRFTNRLDEAASAEPRLRIEPELPGMTTRLRGRDLQIYGQPRPDTRYRVTVEGGVADRFGQSLSGPRTVTFDVGPADPQIALVGGPFIVLDPAGPPQVRVHSLGFSSFNVRVYRVTPDQWPEYVRELEQARETNSFEPPGEPVADRTVAVESPEWFRETLVDVGAALSQGLGHAIVVVGAPRDGPWRPRDFSRHVAWVQGTRIGVSAAVNGTDILGWTTSLDTGSPIADVELRLIPSGRRTTTDAGGTGMLELGTRADVALIARRGNDSALLPSNEHGWGSGWTRTSDTALRWMLFSDRGLYRPGETAHVKGWVRQIPAGRGADLQLASDATALTWRLRGPRGEELGTGEMRTGSLGGFDTALDLPATLNLGHANLVVEPRGMDADRHSGHLGLRVQEFRRPDYEVTLDAEPGPHVIGDAVDLALLAGYYGGGGLGDAQVEWRFTTGPATYRPPGWDRWHFGGSTSWWLPQPSHDSTQVLTGSTDASGAHHVRVDLLAVDPPVPTTLRVATEVQDVTRQAGSAMTTLLVHPAALTVGLQVERSWVARGEPVDVDIVVVDHDGRPAAGRRVQLVRERVTWTWSRGRSSQLEVHDSATACDIVSTAEPVSCTITFDEAGMHRLRADVQDDDGRISRTDVTVWVPGGAALPRQDGSRVELTPDRQEYQPGDTARIMIDAPFAPAEGLLTVRNGGILTTEQFRVTGDSHELRIPITERHISSTTVQVTLVDAERAIRTASGTTQLAVPPHTRTLDVSIMPRDSIVAPGAETLVDVLVQNADGRPAANAEVALWMVDEAVLAIGGYVLPDPLAVFYAPRHAHVQEQANRAWVMPWPISQGPGTVAGTVLGNLNGASVADATVRLEGTDISAVTSFDGTFVLRGVAPGDYTLLIDTGEGAVRRVRITVPADGVNLGNVVLTPEGAGAGDAVELQALVVTGAASRFAEAPLAVAPPPPPPAPGGAQEVEVRSDFSALAVFEPSLRTDANGRVQVRVRMPASLTRYRVMAVAVSGAREFGTGESTVTASRQLMARITAPRFLNYGDAFELPVLVQNIGADALTVDVAARAAGLRMSDAGRRVVLQPGGRAEVRFPATALRPGTARVQVITSAATQHDALSVDIPVYTPATTEAFATYGVIDSNAPVLIPVSRPRDVIPAFGGAEISITSTAVHALTDAVLYFHTYPFTGAEHLSSRIMAVAALRDVLAAFAAEQLPSPDSLVAATQRDVARLAALQNGDGGWGYWFAGEISDPFVSVHAAHALERARENGFAVEQTTLQPALEYLRRIDTALEPWPLRVRQSVRAYALYVRHALDDAAALAEARSMVAQPVDRVGGELPIEAAAWLLHVIASDPSAAAEAAELRRLLLNRVEETAGGASFTARYDDGAHLLLHSDRRTDAVVLEALITTDPGNDLIPKIANSLLAHRVRGRWAGTQETAWVLLALNRYFRTYEATTPDFESGVWLGERFAGSSTFQGRTTDRQHIAIPMPELLRADTATLIVAREGEGRMYYRAGLRYAPADLRPDALDRGFTVSRVYEAADDSADVQRTADGTWRIRAGARVRVRVLMTAPSRRSHVALVDPMPAGFEPLNPELRGTGFTDGARPAPDPRARPMPQPVRSWWFVHQNLRDDRAEAFATLLPAGLYEYSYLARATTPGTFVVPPPRVEMMYEPETFGRGSGDSVVIVP